MDPGGPLLTQLAAAVLQVSNEFGQQRRVLLRPVSVSVSVSVSMSVSVSSVSRASATSWPLLDDELMLAT